MREHRAIMLDRPQLAAVVPDPVRRFSGTIWRNQFGAICIGDQESDNWAFSPQLPNLSTYIGHEGIAKIIHRPNGVAGYRVTLHMVKVD